jgi:hypothetical protein
MRLSFDDKESFKEAVESLRFNNPPSDPNTDQQVGSTSSMPPEERNEARDICFNNPSLANLNDPNTLQRFGMGRSSTSIKETQRSEDA